MKFLIGLLAFFLLGVAAIAAEPVPGPGGEQLEPPQSEVLFFEPTKEDATNSSKKILAQQERYKAARAAGNYAEARRLALFHVSLAWTYHNEAVGVLRDWAKNSWCKNPDKLREALQLWSKMDDEVEAARKLESRVNGPQGVNACAALAKANRERVSALLESIESGKKCK